MKMDTKKRRVISLENLDETLKAAFNEKYPRGFSDYLPDLTKYDKPDGSFFYAVTIETEDTVALVKIQVKTDAIEDIERWLDSEEDEEREGGDEDGENLPDDNIAQYSNGEEDPAEQD